MPEPGPTESAPLALLFHENSKLAPATAGALSDRVAEFASDPAELRRAATGAKTYATTSRVVLPPRQELPRPNAALDRVLADRRSVRAYAHRPAPAPPLLALLDHACGVTGSWRDAADPSLVQPLRAAPSGGALYPIETYAAIFEADGLEPGIYHFQPRERCLERVRAGSSRAALQPCVYTTSGKLDAPVLLLLTGRWRRVLAKYGERGYRILWLDAGHLAQNLLLTATALGLGACCLAGFMDDRLAEALGLDPREEPVLYALTVGIAAK